MADKTTPLYRWSHVDGVAVVEILPKELSGPDIAEELGQQLYAFVEAGEKRLLLNFGRTQVMSSTSFGVLFNLWKRLNASQGQLRICCMQPPVRFGADVLSLGEYVPIHDDEASALAAFTPEATAS